MLTQDSSSPLRAEAALPLAKDPDPKSREALAKAVYDTKWLVRAAVAEAIARKGDPALLNAAILLLGDDNDHVRFNAAAAIVHLTAQSR